MKRLVLSMLLTLTILLATSGTSAMPMQFPIGVSGEAEVTGTQDIQASVRHELLKQTVALWSDGRGDVILERRVRNTSILNWTSSTWYFDWSPGIYSEIRAWDSRGPLNYSTTMSGSRIYVTVYFRTAVPIGQSYQFSLAITIDNMTRPSGSNWRAAWYTRPASPVNEFIRGVTFPSNSVIQSATPPPTTQDNNYLEWREINRPAGWEHTIDVYYTLSDSISVPLLLQTNSVLPAPNAPWASDPYGNYPSDDEDNTIARWGCHMTSAAMIINYWAERHQVGFRTNPGDFNAWLRDNSGYDASSNVVHAKIGEYAKHNAVPVYIRGDIRQRDDSVLDDYLLSGNPVILGVGGHFVVATGRTKSGGVDTYAINDPIYGQTTLSDRWNNDYYSILLLSGTPADQRSLRISAHSPVALLVTDPQGRRAGYDPSSDRYWDEIPETEYFVESIAADADASQGQYIESKILLISLPIDGEYTVEVHGTGHGAYEINAFASDWLGRVSEQVYRGTAQDNSVDSFSIDYSSSVGLYSSFLYLPLIASE